MGLKACLKNLGVGVLHAFSIGEISLGNCKAFYSERSCIQRCLFCTYNRSVCFLSECGVLVQNLIGNYRIKAQNSKCVLSIFEHLVCSYKEQGGLEGAHICLVRRIGHDGVDIRSVKVRIAVNRVILQNGAVKAYVVQKLFCQCLKGLICKRSAAVNALSPRKEPVQEYRMSYFDIEVVNFLSVDLV